MDSFEEKFISRETALHFNIFFGTRAVKIKTLQSQSKFIKLKMDNSYESLNPCTIQTTGPNYTNMTEARFVVRCFLLLSCLMVCVYNLNPFTPSLSCK